MSKKTIALVYSALIMALAPTIGIIYVLYKMGIDGATIVPDERNVLELWLAIGVVIINITALVVFINFMVALRGI